ncbi:MAG: 50S ribosomal protein L21 [Kyrpidia tusciae]|nr:50S ribosomal protein L21 [Kyrpidia tusciae]MBE3551576.1 50S ribosomal protein L21 [Kyrpidia tusciae]
MYAVMQTGGKQYRVEVGDVIYVEKLPADEGAEVEIPEVLLLGKEDGVVIGTPLVPGAKVKASVLKQGKAKKIIVYKYKPKKNYRRKYGHRQPWTKLRIEAIEG